MIVIPAIDLRGGRCVRLYQGDYDRETVFSEQPGETARGWEEAGAQRLHVVDLDGARAGEPQNWQALAEILAAVSIPVQVGGGVRSLATIERLVGLGVERAILGTVAIEQPELIAEASRIYGEGIIAGIDARDGQVATRGWRETSTVRAEDLLQEMATRGVRRFIYTDIARDGTLAGPNFAALASLLAISPCPVIASGGVATVEHLQRLEEMGAEGAIVGQALYTGTLDRAVLRWGNSITPNPGWSSKDRGRKG